MIFHLGRWKVLEAKAALPTCLLCSKRVSRPTQGSVAALSGSPNHLGAVFCFENIELLWPAPNKDLVIFLCKA